MMLNPFIRRYWAATIIVFCILYWCFHASWINERSVSQQTGRRKGGSGSGSRTGHGEVGISGSRRVRVELDEAEEQEHLQAAQALLEPTAAATTTTMTTLEPSQVGESAPASPSTSTSTSDTSNSSNTTSPKSESESDIQFPRIVWQTASERGREKYADKAATWQKAKGYQYNFLTDDGADQFVHDHFASRPGIVHFWDELSVPVLRADLLRYLLMLAVGGVYSDIDTSMRVHPDQWIPADLKAEVAAVEGTEVAVDGKEKQGTGTATGTETEAATVDARIKAHVVIGIEYDDDKYPMFVRPIGFCQWTLMSKPGHAIFELAVQRVISNVEYIARRRRVPLHEVTLDKMEVLEATGPGMVTDVVMQVLREQGHNVTWDTFHELKKPRLYGDVLILPINGFAGSQKHSHAGDPAYGKRFVQHHFGRSWYVPEPEAEAALEKAKEDKAREEKAKEEKAREDKAKEDKAKEDKPKEEKAKEDETKEDKAKEEKIKAEEEKKVDS